MNNNIVKILSLTDEELLEKYFQTRLLWCKTGEMEYFIQTNIIVEDILNRFKGRIIYKST